MEFCDESYDLVNIDEFDALWVASRHGVAFGVPPCLLISDDDAIARSSIELKSGPSSSNLSPSTLSTEKTSSDSSGIICDPQLHETWREGLGKFPGKHLSILFSL